MVNLVGPNVDLTNCDREPIHIPGSIQPHGALVAMDANGMLAAYSENAEAMLGSIPKLGEHFSTGFQSEQCNMAINAMMQAPSGRLEPVELKFEDQRVDAISHRSGDWSLIEFEPHPDDAPNLQTFVYEAQHSLFRIQEAQTIEELLNEATKEVRRLTGFDRVMCYRFRHDESGDVATEERRDDLEPFFGLRFPTSDIPAQARRLYVVSPLRFIADVDAVPVSLIPPLGPDSAKPLDLSQAVLRSVSPIHVEYLKNMGVMASMSVSIVVEGRLWGLFACHHYASPKRVPHAVRVSCKLLSQVLSIMVERMESRRRMEVVEGSRSLREELLEEVRNGDDLINSMLSSVRLMQLLSCDGVAVMLGRKMGLSGSTPAKEILAMFAQDLRQASKQLEWSSDRIRLDFPTSGDFGVVAGVLAMCFDWEHDGWVFWFRNEESETVRWAGNPHKQYEEGPNGPRLSPRGSFLEYREQVKGQSRPWDVAETEAAHRLRVGLQEVALAKISELERARDLLVATLNHDLRGPHYAIDLSAEALSEDFPQSEVLSSRISTYSSRMKRMIEHMLDFNRLQSGASLGVAPEPIETNALTAKIIEETEIAYPGTKFDFTSNVKGLAWIDPGRFEQVLTNLLGNAVHHGEAGKPILVRMDGGGSERLRLEVRNHADEMPAEVRQSLFKALKPRMVTNQTNPHGLGLGLYIVHQIVTEHGGSVEWGEYRDGLVSVNVEFPPAPNPHAG